MHKEIRRKDRVMPQEKALKILDDFEYGVLAHSPESAAVHGGLHTSGKGIQPRVTELALVIFLNIIRGIKGFNLYA